MKCDLFRVVHDKDNHLTPANKYGAAVSIATGLLVVLLLLGELTNYYRGHQQCAIAPTSPFANLTEEETRSLRQVHAVVTFPYVPCGRLQPEMLSIRGGQRAPSLADMQIGRWTVLAGSFERPVRSSLPYTGGGDPHAADAGCCIEVHAHLPHHATSFNIIATNFNLSRPSGIRADHAIHAFRLGDEELVGAVPQVTSDTTESLAGTMHVTEASRAGSYFIFYVQYLRTQIVLPRAQQLLGFQYTAEQSYVRVGRAGMAPGLYTQLIPSPYSIRCTLEYDTVSHFLVNLCAIAGGVYVVASFLELGIEMLAKRQLQRERAYTHALNTETAAKQDLVDQFVRHA